MPAPNTPPTMEWVVETGAFRMVARLIHAAAARRTAIITRTKSSTCISGSGVTIPFEIFETTSPPARRAPTVSHTAAITRAAAIVSALLPTAGPILLATSLAPMFSAM